MLGINNFPTLPDGDPSVAALLQDRSYETGTPRSVSRAASADIPTRRMVISSRKSCFPSISGPTTVQRPSKRLILKEFDFSANNENCIPSCPSKTGMESLKSSIDPARLPKHIAIIMDGNGRWAKGQGQDRLFGHYHGVESVRNVVEACAELGVDI